MPDHMTSAVPVPESPLRLRIDGAALVHNWRWLRDLGGDAACGAAVKADGYGIGAMEVVRHLSAAGCREFFVSSWTELAALGDMPAGCDVAVFHGVRPADMAVATASAARPVLNSPEQIALWRQAGADRPCDIMIDIGMNRLGLTPDDVRAGVCAGLNVETAMGHFSSADDDDARTASEMQLFAALVPTIGARRQSIANSAGICAGGARYALDLTRPGLSLYGGVPRGEADGNIQQVAFPEAEVVQCRKLRAGEGVGYNHQWHAPHDCRIAILHIGYADGYVRGFTNRGHAHLDGAMLPVVGRVSMDLTAVMLPDDVDASAGDWVAMGFNLPEAAVASGQSQYELLTWLGRRLSRYWV